MDISNAEVAEKLQEVAAAYTLKNAGIFQIRAYENAATSIEHLTSEVKDLWEEGRLDQIPGVGESLKEHLDELFKTGKVKHWEDVKKGIPEATFKFLDVPGVGPKTASKLARLGVKSVGDLKKQIESGALVKKGFSKKLAERIGQGLQQGGGVRTNRVLLPYAFTQAGKILNYLGKSPVIEKADALGSLRRMVATIGDIDIAIASKDPRMVVEDIISMPGISRVVDKGEAKVRVIVPPNLQVDFLIIDPSSYGASLQYFTGSKAHNVHLRTLAENMNLSLSEYGVKNTKTGKVHPTPTEEEFYGLLKMEVPPPEIREDSGEIEVALKHQLPDLVELVNIKGDLHIHSNLIVKPSHDVGANSVKEIIEKARGLGYAYMGISDHQPSQADHNQEQMVRILQDKKKAVEHINYSSRDIRVLNLLEVDILPDGSLGVPDEALKLLDFALAGVHSAHHQSKEKMTKRVLRALENPCVKILTHPTNRLLNKREASDIDWMEIFKFVAKNNKALEINSFPDRLDLPDILVRQAKSLGVKFVVGTDSHNIDSMENMKFGVAVARRGWAAKEDIINTWDFTKLAKWFNIKT